MSGSKGGFPALVVAQINNMQTAKITAVIVTYEPELELLCNVLMAICLQVDQIVLFDNGSRRADVKKFANELNIKNIELICSNENIGLAAGINVGISKALANASTHVLILDQDSTPNIGMVEALLLALAEKTRQGVKVAAVGPVFIDRRSGTSAPFVRIRPLVNQKIHITKEEVAEADFLISSGSLIPLSVIQKIGGMDDRLFIDNVDLDWSFRARHAGFCLLGVGAASMEHSIGDRLQRISLLGWNLEISLHGTVRLYYMTRNRVALYFRAYTPWQWVVQDIPRMMLKFIGMTLFVSPRGKNALGMLLGCLHGLRGKLGAVDPSRLI